MLHLMRASISFETTTPGKPSDAVTTVARVADYADRLGSFNRPRTDWFPASVVDTAVALLTGELETDDGVTFTAEDLLCASGARYIAAPVRDAAGTETRARAVLHGFTRRQLKLISARVWATTYPPAPVPVTVKPFLVGKALITHPDFQGGVRRHESRPRVFVVYRFDGDAVGGKVDVGTAPTYAKAGAVLAKHFGQPDLPVNVERAGAANAA